jgi:outer membrane cobalamin receptor
MKFYPAIGLWCSLLLISGNLIAQQPIADTLNIKGVEVTGLKTRKENRSASPVQRMTINEINALPGNSAAEALRNFSGVTLKDYGGLGGLKTVVVRSLGTNHTGIFVDGTPLSDIATGQIDLGKIPLEELQEIELSIGSGQQLCQPARAFSSASLLEFHSVTPDFSKSNLRMKTGLKTGSFGLINPFIGLSLKIGTRTNAGITADYNNTRGDYKYILKNGSQPDTSLKRENADLEAINLTFRIETRFSDSAVLRAKSWLYRSERGLPGAVIFYNPYSSQRLSNRDFFGNVQYECQSKSLHLLSNLNFSNSMLRYRDPAYLNHEGGLDNSFRQQELYLSQAVSMPLKGIFSMGAAADLMVNHMQSDQYTGNDPMRFSGLGSISFQARTSKTEATAVLLGSMVKESKPDNSTSSSKTALSPSLSFITLISSSPLIKLRVLYKNSFRMPTFHDLYYNLVGNAKLKPESVNQWNAGLILSEEIGTLQFNLHTDLFFNQVKDKIVAVPTQNLFVWSMRNLGKVDIKGIEIQTSVLSKLFKTREIALNLNYTHQQALDMSLPGSPTYRQQIAYVPFQTFSGFVMLSGKQLTIGYNLIYNSHRYVSGENITANLLPSWWVHDASISWQQAVKSTVFKIKAEGINLCNRQYEVIRGFPMNGRGFYLTLSVNY